MPEQQRRATEPHNINNLEERVEYKAVTNFRQSLLAILRRLHENEDLRVVITKRGEPAAVILSYEAFELLRRIARRSADADALKAREQRAEEAYLQLAGTGVEAPEALVDFVLDQNYLADIVQKAVRDSLRHELRRRKAGIETNKPTFGEL